MVSRASGFSVEEFTLPKAWGARRKASTPMVPRASGDCEGFFHAKDYMAPKVWEVRGESCFWVSPDPLQSDDAGRTLLLG
eukprot:356516-Chlamydomonas_euryale.AAC.6